MSETSALPPRPQEQLLIDALPKDLGARVLCTSAGLAHFARTAARQFPRAQVDCLYLDLYQTHLARAAIEPDITNLHVRCEADFPAQEYDFAALPLSSHGEAELAREWLQEALVRLVPGGTLAASTDNPRDSWLGEQFERLHLRPQRTASELGAVYTAIKTEPLKKRKRFDCRFAFRDRGRLLYAESRPGVFAHRRIDPGARQVLAALEVGPGERVLDIGCGSGVLSLAAAARAENVAVHALDSNIRAVESVCRGAEANGLSLVTSELTTLESFADEKGDAKGVRNHFPERPAGCFAKVVPDTLFAGAGTYTIALANPPYYARFEIARRFLLAGHAALAPGGAMLVVTKMPEWYAENMGQWFADVALSESKGYWIARGRRA